MYLNKFIYPMIQFPLTSLLVNKKDINEEVVASKIANLHEFISNELPEQYQSIIGERGIKLSEGKDNE